MGGVDDGAAGAEVEWQLVHRKATVSADTNESHEFMDRKLSEFATGLKSEGVELGFYTL